MSKAACDSRDLVTGLCMLDLSQQCSFHVQAHHVTRQVEYRGDVISLTEALVGFPAGGQILLSDATYQRIYGRLHTLNFKDPRKPVKKQTSSGTTDSTPPGRSGSERRCAHCTRSGAAIAEAGSSTCKHCNAAM